MKTNSLRPQFEFLKNAWPAIVGNALGGGMFFLRYPNWYCLLFFITSGGICLWLGIFLAQGVELNPRPRRWLVFGNGIGWGTLSMLMGTMEQQHFHATPGSLLFVAGHTDPRASYALILAIVVTQWLGAVMVPLSFFKWALSASITRK